MGKSAAPQPPDPHDTASASESTNVGTAIANANLKNVNQVTPTGSLTYSQTGTYKWTDPYTGQSYDIPQYTATQTLSPAEQAIENQSEAAQLNLGTIANNQSAAVQDALNTPIDLSSENVNKYLNTHYNDIFNKQWDQNQTALNSNLANRGVTMGSTAYTNAMNDFNNQKSSAWDSLAGSAYNNAVQDIVTQRQEPLNELTALLSGSQVAQPNYVNTNEPTIPTTDTAGLINQNYQDKLAIWQQQQAQSQGILGGLFGLAGSLISDRRAKKDIHEIGETHDGQPIYSFKYKAGGPKQIGLMAQEVEKVHPEAVTTLPGGLKAVDYGKALGSAFGVAA